MTLIVDSSKCRGRVEVTWSSVLPRASAYVVTASVTRHGGHGSLHELENREWIALIRDCSVTTVQLDTASLEQAGGSVVVQGCGSVKPWNFGSAFRIEDRHSKTHSWTAPRSTLATAAGNVVGRNDWQGFVSWIIRRLFLGIFIFLAHWIASMVGRPSPRREAAATRDIVLQLSTSERLWDLSVQMILLENGRALVRWMCDEQRPDKWMLNIVNLTWTVDDLPYHQWIYVIDQQRNEFLFPLDLQNGNRYRVIVRGLKQQRQHVVSTAADCFDVLCRGRNEFRAGEVLTVAQVQYLKNSAITYLQEGFTTHAPCTWFYRNKPISYFEKVRVNGGVMKTLLKDASGDERSPVNGEISGLFFLTNVGYDGEPFTMSPFGDTRLLVDARALLDLAPNVYFADFYCTRKSKHHYVTLVLARPDSVADQLCKQRLIKLSLSEQPHNPFIFVSHGQLKVLKGKPLFVEVFFTENLDTRFLAQNSQACMQYNVPVLGYGSTLAIQGGRPKNVNCHTCMAPGVQRISPRHSVLTPF